MVQKHTFAVGMSSSSYFFLYLRTRIHIQGNEVHFPFR